MLLAPAESPANYASAVSARSDILGERYVSERWGALMGLSSGSLQSGLRPARLDADEPGNVRRSVTAILSGTSGPGVED
jgi:hypothetical protein